MAVTKKLLKGIGLTDDQIESVFEAHMETVNGLKADMDRLKEAAGKAEELQKQLDAAQGDGDLQARFDAVSKELEALKSANAARDQQEKVKAAYRDLLRAEGIDAGRVEMILRKDLPAIRDEKLDKEGRLVNAEKLAEAIRADWGDYKATTETRGVQVGNPPPQQARRMSREEIYKKDDKGRYVLSTAERQQALAESLANPT